MNKCRRRTAKKRRRDRRAEAQEAADWRGYRPDPRADRWFAALRRCTEAESNGKPFMPFQKAHDMVEGPIETFDADAYKAEMARRSAEIWEKYGDGKPLR